MSETDITHSVRDRVETLFKKDGYVCFWPEMFCGLGSNDQVLDGLNVLVRQGDLERYLLVSTTDGRTLWSGSPEALERELKHTRRWYDLLEPEEEVAEPYDTHFKVTDSFKSRLDASKTL